MTILQIHGGADASVICERFLVDMLAMWQSQN